MTVTDRVARATDAIRQRAELVPEVAVILGTGLGQLAQEVEAAATIAYSDIPHFRAATVESHAGRLILGQLSGRPAVVMQGRLHYYEGHSLADIGFPVRVMHKLGARVLIVSNACGGVNPQLRTGDVMVITDHVNLLGDNPLRGPHEPGLGPRFPHMHNCYDRELVELAGRIALEQRLPLQRGVYLALAGPNLETAAEYRMCRILGADVVGMSTVPEVIVARQVGMRVAGFSVITDMGLPDAMTEVSLGDVLDAARRAEPGLTELIRELVRRIP